MEIEQKMKYAMNLADLNFSHEFEDIFKRANLCEEIEKLKDSGLSADARIADSYRQPVNSSVGHINIGNNNSCL